jgi:hypothetical protein
MFDIRSPRSIGNLLAISTAGDLTPWVKQLHFTCSVVGFPSADDEEGERFLISIEKYREYMRRYQEDTSWFPTAWTWSPAQSGLPNAFSTSTTQRKEMSILSKLISSCLDGFRNLEEIGYRNIYCLARYQDIAWEQIPEPAFEVQIGLDLLVHALSTTNTRPKHLELDVCAMESHAFVSYAPRSPYSSPFTAVETLILRPTINVLRGTEEMRNRFYITATNFPSLRQLTTRGALPVYQHDELVAPLPSTSEIPALDNLVLDGYDVGQQETLDFIARYSTRTHTLTLQDSLSRSCASLLHTLQSLSL